MPFRPSPAALGQRKASGAWLSRQQRDPYVKGRGVYRSRSAFKLLELERAHAVLAPRWVRTVVDLGAAPGGWSQAVAEVFGFRDGEAEHDGEGEELHDVDVSPRPPRPADPTARTILALDLLPIAPIAGVHTLQADFLAPSAAPALAALLHARRADVLLSDMAPNATGQRAADVEGALDLAKAVFRFARTHLACASGAHPGGTIV
jgi:23S rRNA (uridine2552-2'-O)-methyltransferase